MRGIRVFLIYFLFCNTFVIAQTSYSKDFDINKDTDNGWKVIQLDSQIVVLTGSRCKNNTANCIGLFSTTLDGRLLWKKEIDSLLVLTPDNLYTDGNSIFLTTFDPRRATQRIAVLKFDRKGKRIQTWPIHENLNKAYPYSMQKYGDGYVLHLLSTDKKTKQPFAWLGFYDDSFNLIRSLSYGGDQTTLFSGQLIVQENGDIIVAYSYASGTLKYTPVIIKMDKQGNTIWKQTLNESGGGQFVRLLPFNNGSFAVSWTKEYWDDPFVFQYPPVVYGMDTDGNALWEKTFYSEYEQVLSNLFVAGKDIVGVGSDVNFEEPDRLGGWLFRMQTDGELIWQRQIADTRYSEPYQFFNNGSSLDNGDLILTGVVLDTFDQEAPYAAGNAWLVRTDNSGCITEQCNKAELVTSITDPPDTLPTQTVFDLYPNPTHNLLYFSSQTLTPFDCQITTVAGKTIAEHKGLSTNAPLDVQFLPSGTYLLQLTTKDHLLFTHKFIKL